MGHINKEAEVETEVRGSGRDEFGYSGAREAGQVQKICMA